MSNGDLSSPPGGLSGVPRRRGARRELLHHTEPFPRPEELGQQPQQGVRPASWVWLQPRHLVKQKSGGDAGTNVDSMRPWARVPYAGTRIRAWGQSCRPQRSWCRTDHRSAGAAQMHLRKQDTGPSLLPGVPGGLRSPQVSHPSLREATPGGPVSRPFFSWPLLPRLLSSRQFLTVGLRLGAKPCLVSGRSNKVHLPSGLHPQPTS